MSYSQYSTSGFTSVRSNGQDSRTWTFVNVQGDASRYTSGTGEAMAFEHASNAPGAIHVWRDDDLNFPVTFSSDGINYGASCDDAQTVYLKAANGDVHSFTSPHYQYYSSTSSSGGVSTFSAVFSPNTSTELSFTVTRSGPTLYEGGITAIHLFDDDVFSFTNPVYTMNWPASTSITSQTGSSLYNFTLDATKTYYLATAQGTTYATSTPESRSGKKKVHCNFW